MCYENRTNPLASDTVSHAVWYRMLWWAAGRVASARRGKEREEGLVVVDHSKARIFDHLEGIITHYM